MREPGHLLVLERRASALPSVPRNSVTSRVNSGGIGEVDIGNCGACRTKPDHEAVAHPIGVEPITF
jgi:hypothetical protein